MARRLDGRWPDEWPPVVAGLRRRLPGASGGYQALVVGLAGIAGSFAVAGPTANFVVTPVQSFVVSVTPGFAITASIQLLGLFSELLALAVAFGLTAVVLTVTARAGIALGRRTGDWFGTAVMVYFAGWVAATSLIRSPTWALAVAVAMGLAAGVTEQVSAGEPGLARSTPDRRRFLGTLAAMAVGGGLAWTAGTRQLGIAESPLSTMDPDEREVVQSRLQTANERTHDVEGLPPLVSSIDEFFEVDINTIDPNVDAGEWQLRVTGAVEEPVTIDYTDLREMPPHHRFETLRCVGDPLNGELLDTALWSGVPIVRLLHRANPTGGHVMLRAADDYYEEFPLSALRDGLLAYAMNGRTLPRDHGHPVRALVPGHWGEINVKWLTEIEVLDQEAVGFWEERGWHGTGPVNTVAKLWTDNRLADGRLQVGGYAYAGTRGIRTVEVSVDGAATWDRATVSEPLPDPDVWRQWHYEWEPTAAEHAVVVRAVDGHGEIQPEQASQPYPSGASGWVRKRVRA